MLPIGCFIGGTSLFAQNLGTAPMPAYAWNDIYEKEHLKADLSISSSGIGIGVGWKTGPHFVFRARYSYLAGGFNFNLPIGNNVNKNVPSSLNIHTNFRMSHFDVLTDYLFLYNENLKLTFGLAVHPNKRVSVNGTLDHFRYHDIEFTPDEVGKITVNLAARYKLSPYLGLGFLHAFPNKKFCISFELGSYYLGDWRVDGIEIQEGIILDKWKTKPDGLEKEIGQAKERVRVETFLNSELGNKLLPNINIMINYLIF